MLTKSTLAGLLAACGLGLTAAPAAAQNRVTERVTGLKLVDDSIFAEAYYNGSSFSGGGIMSAIATVQITERNAAGKIVRRVTEERNVSLADGITWESSDPSIYDIEYFGVIDGNGRLPDGLWIYGGDSTQIGTTTVTVTYKRFTATGTITFWAD